MSTDVQYGTPVASVYDRLITRAIPVDDTLARLAPDLVGARALEVGVGTGRVALPAAARARSVVGVDNSPAMLAALAAKDVPANLELVQADFRAPLPVSGPFDLAYATLGSLACVRSTAELTDVLRNVAAALRPGAPLHLEYYAAPVYRHLATLGPVTVPLAGGGGTVTCTVELDDDVMTVTTQVDADGPPVEFAEQVLLVEPDEVRACLLLAGLVDVRHDPAEDLQPYDWYCARTPTTAEGTTSC